MIVVIADDLTGAAELGGIGLRFGLSVEIVTTVNRETSVDLLIIAMDTRSMPESDALAAMSGLTGVIQQLKPTLLYKKVDSVLRGHIITEVNVHLQQLGLKRALIVPANPAFGRTISGGQYYINGKPIHLTSFANDPEFAISSSSVRDMLRTEDDDFFCRTSDEELPESGIILGECGCEDDLFVWASKVEPQTLVAGGSGFFKAMLKWLNLKTINKPVIKTSELVWPALFVCGSTFSKSRQLVEKANKNDGTVSYMPQAIVSMAEPTEELFELWADEVCTLLLNHNKAIIAVNENTTADIEVFPGNLREKKAKVVEKIINKIALKELLVEGGATGAAIIKRLGINKFIPVNEFSTGVIRMRTGGQKPLFLTLKPGSYDWPSYIWHF
ncbi:MAG: four-carbon acid sugar kinase family protein [Mucilaginibacter sp.]